MSPVKSNKNVNCIREKRYENQLYEDILQNQQMDRRGYLADTVLICNGGNIRAHAFILENSSPFFRAVFTSQGRDYPFLREILLPDFDVREMEALLNILYRGYVELFSEKQVVRLQDTLEFFKISGVDFEGVGASSKKLDRSVKVETDYNRIPPEIHAVQENVSRKRSSSKNKMNVEKSEKTPKEPAKVPTNGSSVILPKKNPAVSNGPRGGIPRKGRVEPDGDKSDQDESSEESDSGEDCMIPIVRKRIKTDPSNQKKEVAKTKPSHAPPPPQNAATQTQQQDTAGDGIWTPPNYKDPEWFERESCRCQICGITYENMTDATKCVTSDHRHWRCYFCFHAFPTVDVLFKHLKTRHEQGHKEGNVKCPYCGDQFPYRNVSTHVIGHHMNKR